MRRGELRLVHPGFIGGRRREAEGAEALLAVLVEAPDLDALISDPAVLGAVLPPGMEALAPFGGTSRGTPRMQIRVADQHWVLCRGAPRLGRRPSTAERAHAQAHSLHAAGVSTPPVLAWLTPSRPDVGPSWWVTPYVSAPSLHELRGAGPGPVDPPVRRRYARGLGEVLGRVHRLGWRVPGLGPDQILVADRGLVLLEPESLVRGRGRILRRDVLALAAAFRGDVGPLDRVHFLRAYLGPVPSPRSARARWFEAALRGARSFAPLPADAL